MTTKNEPVPLHNGQAPAVSRRRSPGWIWFFVVLFLLAGGATAILWIYNLRQQLTPEELAAARQLWKKNRPRNYRLTYTKEGNIAGTFVVTVRNGEVKSVVMKQEVTENGSTKTVTIPLEKRFYKSSDMDGLFNDLKRFLELKRDPEAGRPFLTAKFDPDDGHINGFIYSNSKTGQRIKVVAELDRLPD